MVLERDWFRCKYCWKSSEFVELEVDHIVPVKEWWDNGLENLVTACRTCNLWKWSKILSSYKEIYKQKISDNIRKIKSYFYEKWNANFMWMIDKKTQTLLSICIKDYWWSDYYKTVLDVPPLHWWKKLNPEETDYTKLDQKFKSWWEFCDNVLCFVFSEAKLSIDYDIEVVFDDKNWYWNKEKDYSRKLNYHLTEEMSEYMKDEWREYILYKFSLFPKLVSTNEV